MADTLRATEAAVISDVPLREVNRVVDEKILPSGSYALGRTRRFSPGACVMISFYHASADDLTRSKRSDLLGKVEPRLRHLTFKSLRSRLKEDWRVTEGIVTIDFRPLIEGAVDRLEQLREATEMVTTSEHVMGGVPVIRGTRVPVRDVAASLKAGHALARIQAAYPSLSDRQIQLSGLYADANPLRGRPKVSPIDGGGAKVSERRVKRLERAE